MQRFTATAGYWKLDAANRRSARLALLKRQRPYRAKPDLPGMRKRDRRYAGGTLRGARYGSEPLKRADLLYHGVIIRCRRRRRRPERERRELLPRPKRVRSNKRLYCRPAEHARETFGRFTGLTWEFWE